MANAQKPRRNTRPETIIRAEQQRKALSLRRAGAGYRQIAEALQISIGAAHGLVIRGLDELAKYSEEDARYIKAIESLRLDEMWMAIYPDITKGHLGAIDRGLRVMERRARLIGLDEPAQVNNKHALDKDSPLESAAAGLASLLKATEQLARGSTGH